MLVKNEEEVHKITTCENAFCKKPSEGVFHMPVKKR
jgi:hypothetical protein